LDHAGGVPGSPPTLNRSPAADQRGHWKFQFGTPGRGPRAMGWDRRRGDRGTGGDRTQSERSPSLSPNPGYNGCRIRQLPNDWRPRGWMSSDRRTSRMPKRPNWVHGAEGEATSHRQWCASCGMSDAAAHAAGHAGCPGLGAIVLGMLGYLQASGARQTLLWFLHCLVTTKPLVSDSRRSGARRRSHIARADRNRSRTRRAAVWTCPWQHKPCHQASTLASLPKVLHCEGTQGGPDPIRVNARRRLTNCAPSNPMGRVVRDNPNFRRRRSMISLERDRPQRYSGQKPNPRRFSSGEARFSNREAPLVGASPIGKRRPLSLLGRSAKGKVRVAR
jgi:hypothetical protein